MIVLSNIAGGSLGLIALLACAGLSLVASKIRFGMTVAVVGTSLVGLAARHADRAMLSRVEDRGL